MVNYQNYIGTSAPITFNGLVRHYDLRGGSNMADIQVNLLHKEERDIEVTTLQKKYVVKYKKLLKSMVPM